MSAPVLLSRSLPLQTSPENQKPTRPFHLAPVSEDVCLEDEDSSSKQHTNEKNDENIKKC